MQDSIDVIFLRVDEMEVFSCGDGVCSRLMLVDAPSKFVGASSLVWSALSQSLRFQKQGLTQPDQQNLQIICSCQRQAAYSILVRSLVRL
jgi:hypothetical protein